MVSRLPTILRLIVALAAFTLPPHGAQAAEAPAGGAPLGLDRASWTVVEPARSFGPDTLYEEIDGEAELFLPYEFRELTVLIVSPAGSPNVSYRVERYLHGSPREAYGIYSQHRFPGQEVGSVGRSEAIVSDASLDFFRGDAFVRIRAASAGASRAGLLALGEAVWGALSGSADPPAEIRALAVEGFIPGTAVYQKRAILGHEALAPGFEAKIRAGDLEGTVLLLPQKGNGREPRLVDRLRRSFPGLVEAGPGLYRVALSKRTLWLVPFGRFLCGIAGELTREQAVPVIRRLEQNLKGLPPDEGALPIDGR